MQVISDREEMIFRQDKDGKRFYSIGLSRKDQNGNFINGYMTVVFKKDVELENKTKIKIKEAWLGFNVKDKKTYPHIFINDFEVVESGKEVAKEETNPFEEFGQQFEVGHQIEIEDSDLPF